MNADQRHSLAPRLLSEDGRRRTSLAVLVALEMLDLNISVGIHGLNENECG